MLKLPAPSQKVIFQREILELGSYNNLTQHDMCPIFLLQTSLHPCAQASHAGKKRITNFFKHFLSTCTIYSVTSNLLTLVKLWITELFFRNIFRNLLYCEKHYSHRSLFDASVWFCHYIFCKFNCVRNFTFCESMCTVLWQINQV